MKYGVGNRLSNFLVNNNIKSALNLRDSNADFIKKEKEFLLKKLFMNFVILNVTK